MTRSSQLGIDKQHLKFFYGKYVRQTHLDTETEGKGKSDTDDEIRDAE